MTIYDHDFKSKFQIYSEIGFLRFDLENVLIDDINNFSISFTKNLFLEIDEKRYVVPFQCSLITKDNKRDQYGFNDLCQTLGFVPIFDLKLTSNKIVNITIQPKGEKIEITEKPTSNMKKQIDDALVKIYEYNKLYNKKEDTYDMSAIKNVLQPCDYEEHDDMIILKNENCKVVIIPFSIALLDVKYKDYDVIHADFKKLYMSKCKEHYSESSVISVGYFVRKDNILFETKQRLALLDNGDNDNLIIDLFDFD